MNKSYYVYKITNEINNKFYIGRRTIDRIPKNDGYFGSGVTLKHAIDKYGKENFRKEIIEICDDFEILCEREEFWIEELQAVEKGYNMTYSSFGFESGESHPRYSLGLRGERSHNYGRTHSKETIEKFSKNRRGSKNNMYGVTHTKEARQKVSEANKGKVPFNKGISEKRVICPHCNKKGGSNAMHRWHFDNCKFKAI